MSEQATEPAFRKRAGYHGALLGGFATLAATLLVIGNLATFDSISERTSEDLQASLRQVIPDNIHDNNLLDNQIIVSYENNDFLVYQALEKHQVTAVAYSVTGQGYGGEIKLIMGVNANGEILGVRVISHAETPGLGDRIEEKKDDWIFSFNGRSFKNLPRDKWGVKKDGGEFDQFSGATITPRAVVKAIKAGMDMFTSQRGQLLSIKTEIRHDNADNTSGNKS